MANAKPPAPRALPLEPAAIEREFHQFDAEQLRTIIEIANEQYWDAHAPVLPDTLYDRLVEALRRMAPDDPLLDAMGPNAPDPAKARDVEEMTQLSPAQRLGAPVRHQRPMLSLEKCYSSEELLTWATKKGGDLLVMPKMDGVACSLLYDANGNLELAATRGSGEIGEDITQNILQIPSIPKAVAAPGSAMEVRGEVYMKLSTFRSHYAGQFSHPRNLTAGSLKQKDGGSAKTGHLSFYAYDIDGLDLDTESKKLEKLQELGFDSDLARVIAYDEIAASVEEFTNARIDLDYEIDGIVYRVASTRYYQELGATGHHPRGAIAYKFQGDSAITTLRDVQWSVSRTGTITPVAIFEGVDLSGAQLTRASLHNLNRFEELKLCEGAQLRVTRRGGVIPMVEAALTPGDPKRPMKIPVHCPACQGAVERRKKRDGEFLYCVAPENCVSARLRELEHFAKVTDMQGFGPKVLALATQAELLASPPDFFRLTVEDLESLERLGRKSAQNLVDEVQKKRILPLPVFLQSLGVDHLGKQNALRLAEEFCTIEALRAADRERIMQIHGFKDAIADAIVDGLAARSELIDALLHEIQVEAQAAPSPQIVAASEDAPLAGRSFLFTGALDAMPRSQAEKLVLEAGGTISSGVSKKLDYLILGQGTGKASSKEKKARALVDSGASLQILSESEFFALLPASLVPSP